MKKKKNDYRAFLKKSGFKGFIVSISNPCDIVAHYLQIKLDWPSHMIVGTSTGLDSSRLLRCLYEKYHVNRRSIEAFGIGEHGGSAVVPCPVRPFTGNLSAICGKNSLTGSRKLKEQPMRKP